MHESESARHHVTTTAGRCVSAGVLQSILWQ